MAITLLIIGGLGLIRGFVSLRHVRADPNPAWHTAHALWRFVTPAAGYLGAVVVGGLLRRGEAAALDWLVAAIMMLGSSAAESSWEQLKEIGNRQVAAGPSG